ncbi:MAG: hypothetical protein Q9172_001958 [Xanthocarpia lactea]
MEDVSETPPKDIDPYTTLNLTPSASNAEIRTAYKRLALKHHPDKAEPSQKSSANSTFQNIAFAYAILSSPHRRTLYDTTRSTSETLSSLSQDDDFNWLSFFRTQYSSLSAVSIDEFSNTYKRSGEERKDLLVSYAKYKGKLNGVFEDVLLSNPLEDEDRFREILNEAIGKGEVEGYPAYVNETQASKNARMKKARQEAEEAEREQRANEKYQSIFGGDGEGPNESPVANKENDTDVSGADPMTKRQKKAMRAHGDLGNLAAMIQSRNKARGETFLDNLAAKYGSTSATDKGTKRKAEEEPDEAAFQKTKAKMAKANAEDQDKTGRNGKTESKSRGAAAARKVQPDAVDAKAQENEDENIDHGEKSDDVEDESEDELVTPKTNSKPKAKAKAKAQKGKARKAAPPAARRNTRSRAKK